MDKPTITSFDALFAREKSECTRLSIACETDQLIVVRGVCSRVRHDDFEVQELVEHHAQPSRQDVQKLFNALEDAHLENWYHRYEESRLGYYSWYRERHDGRWVLRITYQDGSSKHWEGNGAAPDEIDAVYEACTKAGMPPLHLGYDNTFADHCLLQEEPFAFALRHLERYQTLITTAMNNLKAQFNETARDERDMLASECVDDLALFCREYRIGPLSESLPEGWGKERTPEELCERNVDHASKAQVFALFESLTKQDDPLDAMLFAITSGAYKSWFERLREIPREEERERARQEELERKQMREKLDALIERNIEQRTPFTSVDLAREIGTNTSLANARIRRYLQQERLTMIDENIPKTYRAA